ncbi:4Fe-4S binding protein [candidate division WOR-3 bacterium]|nr:4Fe-4S binding protein [candidate division WOR-3 bacterium]
MKLWRRPLDEGKYKIPKGDIHILQDRCKGCGFCVEYCPRDVLVMSEHFNKKGYHPPEVSKPEACVECHLCEMLCPEFAIYVIKQEEENPACAGVQEGEK